MIAARFLPLTLALTALACGRSHVAGECRGDAPLCAMPCSAGSLVDCGPVFEAGCVAAEWTCGAAAFASDCMNTNACSGETDGGSMGCAGEPARCTEVVSGCCGAAVDQRCVAGSWQCPPGSELSPDCSDPCVGECSGLSWTGCLSEAACVPLLDDRCCPTCTDGPCSDCQSILFQSCERRAEVCASPEACGSLADGNCEGDVPDCSRAEPTTAGACDVAGCVAALQVEGCGGPCSDELSCRPVRAESCAVSCRRAAPACPPGMTAEGDGSCYTGYCVPFLVCFDDRPVPG